MPFGQVYNVRSGQWETEPAPVITEMGYAPLIQRRTASFPARMVRYWDCTAWGAGYFRIGGPGAAVLCSRRGICLDMSSGRVYSDSRFVGK